MDILVDRLFCLLISEYQKTKMKVDARNNVIRKFANSECGFRASTLTVSHSATRLPNVLFGQGVDMQTSWTLLPYTTAAK